jgi:CheY-like chemotaxis protein
MTELDYEPFVILERGGTPAAEGRSSRPRTSFRGRKPAILLVDGEGTGLDLPLAAEGFGVYRTRGRESALEMLRAHPSVAMALVRVDLPGLDAADLIRELRRTRPGLWIGLWGDPADRDRSAAGYEAGATDLVPSTATPEETVARLVRTLPSAIRLQEAAERRQNRRSRRASPLIGRAVGAVLALALGVGLAVVTRAWHESRDLWAARLDRFLGSMEPVRPDRMDRQFDRWNRFEELNLLREHNYTLRSYYAEQLELQRAREALGTVPPPRYSVR